MTRAARQTFERYRPLVDDWEAFVAVQEWPLAPTVWTNTLRTTPEALRAFLLEEGVEACDVPWYPGALRLPPDAAPGKLLAKLLGLAHIQEEVSLLPILLLDPQPDERLLDLCAAPGNKTVQAAVRMGDRGTVVANDRSHKRLGLVVANLERLGVTIGAVTAYDAGNLPRDFGSFDRVLADVPCSCEGTARKNPEVLRREGRERRPTHLQRAILKKAVQLCRPGGRIVYSTCTYAPEENEAIVDEAVASNGAGLRLLPARVDGFLGSPGLVEWEGRRFAEGMEQTLRVWPHHNDTGGFFVAVLEKLAP